MPTRAVGKILLPVYVPVNESIRYSLIVYLKSLMEDLDIDDIDILTIEKRFIEIVITGSDARIALNFLQREFGKPLKWEDIREELTFRGFVRAMNDYAVYVDIGLLEPDFFKIKIPFSNFVQRIFRVSKKIDKELFSLFGVRQYFPLYVKLDFNREIDEQKRIIYGCIALTTARMFRKWISSRLDRLIILGATRSQVEKAIKNTGHLRDIVKIERLGFLEHAVICKWGTSARGLIPELGPFLPYASFSVLMPRLLKKTIMHSN